jgi:uroporphyrinogen-III decarboxylase
VVEKYGQTHVIVGNADTRILLYGSKDEIYAEVERCLRLGRDCPGYFLAVGNHIPPNTPVENALYYNQVYEELCWR